MRISGVMTGNKLDCAAVSRLDELKAYLELAKEYGLQELEVDGVKFKFLHKVEVVPPPVGAIPIHGEKMPSDDELLFYSADSPIQAPS